MVGAEFTGINPEPLGPVIEENDPWYEIMRAFGESFNFKK